MYKLTEDQKESIRLLEIIDQANEDNFFKSLELELSDASIRRAGEKTNPILIENKKLGLIIKRSDGLREILESLEDHEIRKLKELAGFRLQERGKPDSDIVEWSELDLPWLLKVLTLDARSIIEDNKKVYGSRNADKAISRLIPFWEKELKLSIYPISDDGKFVQFVAIVLEKNDPGAAREAIRRYLDRRKVEQSS